MKNLRIGNKITSVPLIQGGMGVGISLGRLAGSVAKAGGIGVISTAQIGYQEPDFHENTEQANLRAIEKEMQRAREISKDGIIGYNIMTALREQEAHVRAAVKAGADIIFSGAGIPAKLPEYVEGSNTKIAPIVSTARSAQVVLKYWDRKYHRTADMVVVEGPLAGGHLGFSKEELETWKSGTYEEEFRGIRKVLRTFEEKYHCQIPLVAAGGIWDAARVAEMEKLGADAVQVATRFIPTQECDADIRYKEAFLQAKEEDISIVKSPVGMPGRAILNPFMKRVMSGEKIPHSPCHRCLEGCHPGEIPYCITDSLIAAARGDVDHGLLFCGAYGWKAEKIETVEEVIASLFPNNGK